jgi:methionyl-tRNA formyltransferase
MTTTTAATKVRAERRTPRIVFVTPEEPSVMPAFFAKVLPELADDIAAIAVVSPIFKRSSWLSQAKRFADAFGAREFAVEALQFGAHKLADAARRIVPRGAHHSVKSVARAHGCDILMPQDVNAPEFLAHLRGLDPDLVISVSCPQIFHEELLSIPTLGCINVHSALLPDYRGMLPTFWVLANGEERTGVTVHHMTPGIDGGGIVLQRAIEITPAETLHSLMGKTKAVAADLVLEAIDRFREGPAEVSPNPPDEGSYFSFPTREDVRRFRARGRRLR